MSFIKNILKKDWNLHYVVWLIICYIATVFAVDLLVEILMPIAIHSNLIVLNVAISALVYVILIGLVIGIPALWQKTGKRKLLKLLGLDSWPSWKDLLRAVGMFFVYYGIEFAVLIIIGLITQWLGANGFQEMLGQEQSVGFTKYGNSVMDLVFIFVALVVIPPICEEIVMRGFLFGKLRQKMQFKGGFWVASIITSLLFAVAHGQWNVGIDTFILSMVLCWVRRETGSIWTGIFVHILKNGLAFLLLYTSLLDNLSYRLTF